MGEECFQGFCSPNRTWGLTQDCLTGLQSEVVPISFRRAWVRVAVGWIVVRIGDRRLVVHPRAMDPFLLVEQPGGRGWKS